MKIIDRHILKSLFIPLSNCLLAFTMLYIVFDLFNNMTDFIEAKTPLMSVIHYYLFLIPSVLIYIVPISLLLSILYALFHLTRNNELTAMRACGLSISRLMVPFMVVGFLAALTVSIVNETLGPWSTFWTNQFLRYLDTEEHSAHVVHNLAFKNEIDRRIWLIRHFNTKTFEMHGINMIQQREDGSDEYKIQAQTGRWRDRQLVFEEEVIKQKYDQMGNPMGPPIFKRHEPITNLSEQPANFLNEVKDPEYLSSWELVQFLKTHKNLSDKTRARMKVTLQSRLAMPWTCFIVTMIGIPFGAQTGRKGAFIGIISAIALFFSFYVLINLCSALGKKEILDPIIAGWAPNIVYLTISIFMIHRMR